MSDYWYFGSGHYFPAHGRFLQRDPAGFVNTLTSTGGPGFPSLPVLATNQTGYALQDPINYIDPDGKNAALIIGGVLVAGFVVYNYTSYQNAARGKGAVGLGSLKDPLNPNFSMSQPVMTFPVQGNPLRLESNQRPFVGPPDPYGPPLPPPFVGPPAPPTITGQCP